MNVVTNIHTDSVLSGALDVEALLDLSTGIHNCTVTHLPGLHAKVYAADTTMAIVTSANLTDAGLLRNIEYGIALTDVAVVSEIRRDFAEYAALGCGVPRAELAGLAEDARDLRVLYRRAQQTVQLQVRRALRQKIEATTVRVLQNHARGRTTQSILAETILFALQRGPLRTAELHPLVQSFQPDLCDDAVDRVIDGVHFGK